MLSVHIKIPFSYSAEREWICSVIFGNFLGLSFTVEKTDDRDYSIHHANRVLTLPDVFFSRIGHDWLKASKLPNMQQDLWDVASSGLGANLVSNIVPVLLGQPGFHLDNFRSARLNLDVFGSAFFMLSRYEEAVLSDRDNHDRFPAKASIAYKAGFLDRPIIDEYVEILWAAMKRVWPNMERKKRKSRISISCDVDQPYSFYVKSVPLTIKKIVGDVAKRKSLGMAVKSGLNAILSKYDNFHFEPNDTFEWIMDVNETAGNKIMFNFMAGRTVADMDSFYSLDEPRIRKLMRRIHERGHEVGLHASYATYKSAEQHFLEANRLRRVMHEEGINQDEIGNRQHYLRWSTAETPANLERAGINYDTTLGYADHPGFRCGTSIEFPMYDLIARKVLCLRERPLIVMEESVIDDCYLGMGHTDAALALMIRLRNRALQFGGNFTLLWHNSDFMTAKDRKFFETLIK